MSQISSLINPNESASQISPYFPKNHSSNSKVNQSQIAQCYFSQAKNGYQLCLVDGCSKKIKQYEGTKQNLVSHLKAFHKEIWAEAIAKKNTEGQSNLSNSHGSSIIKSMNVHLQNNFTDNLVRFIIQDQQSYALVKSKSFQKLIHTLNKDINSISETKISKWIKQKFLNDKEHIFTFINSQEPRFSFSTDIWSGPGGMLYITLTAHCISSTRKSFTATIGFSKFTEAHTGKNIYTKIVDMLNDFFIEHSQKPRGSKRDAIQIDTSSYSSSETKSDLSNFSNDLYILDISSISTQIMAITLNNASSNTKFMDLAVKNHFLKGFDSHIQCFAHILNLAAKDSLKELDGSIDKLKKMVHLIRQSNTSWEHFKSICEKNKEPPNRPMADNATRWNSTYSMLCSALKQKSSFDDFIYEYNKSQTSKQKTNHFNSSS
ncbi:hypothetical protein O181_116305 [Austropuccinia psidii MF-1]|uniref:BED-type domain-containing protein n=1 Tax=Austropuccinia psidii MF-1 TaxID=1389203 RepID=A0A9Q3PXA3_9BASI|nr:hypothetical protein [Austropuccinia psidii MF-1]